MKFSITFGSLTIALLISLCGFVVSMVMPENQTSDALMIAALFCAAASGMIASVFTKKLSKSKQWKYVLTGGLLLLLSFPLNMFGYDFLNSILKVSGGVITIIAFGCYFYLHQSDFLNNKWIWFIPFILLGCLFKYMQWFGGNLIVFTSLLLIAALAIIQLFRLKNYSWAQLLLLVWQIAMCGCIAAFYFRHIQFDPLLIGYIFTWLALMEILLKHEINMLENNKLH